MAEAQSDTNHSGPEEGESIPKIEEWWKTFVLFQGCWLMPAAAKNVALVQAKFQPRPDNIILVTYPKCGTTWLKALAFATANRSRQPVTGNNHPLLTHNPHDLVPFLEMPDRSIHPVTELEALPSPRLLCTHVPLTLLPSGTLAPLALDCRVVYLCREPKDVLVSTWYHVQKLYKDYFFIDFDKAFELFCEGVSFYGPTWKHYLEYWEQSMIEPNNVLFLKYDDMLAEPAKHVKVLAEFLHVPFTDEEESSGVVEEIVRLCSFENLKSLPVNCYGMADQLGGGLPIKNSLYFRNAKVGDWTNHMTKEMVEKLHHSRETERVWPHLLT